MEKNAYAGPRTQDEWGFRKEGRNKKDEIEQIYEEFLTAMRL